LNERLNAFLNQLRLFNAWFSQRYRLGKQGIASTWKEKAVVKQGLHNVGLM